MNQIILNEAFEMVNKCKSLGIIFKELEAHVVEAICVLITGD